MGDAARVGTEAWKDRMRREADRRRERALRRKPRAEATFTPDPRDGFLWKLDLELRSGGGSIIYVGPRSGRFRTRGQAEGWLSRVGFEPDPEDRDRWTRNGGL